MKGYKHPTAEQRVRILELHRRPTDTPTIAAAVGVSIQSVQNTIRRAGLPLTGAKGGACYREPDRVRALAAQGLSLSEMARQLGTNKRLVKKFLDDHHGGHSPYSQAGPNNPAWKGGRLIDKAGYILIHRPDHPEANRHGYCREHRLVMETKIGRPLAPGEVVHHIDGNPGNNDPNNLELFATNGEHLAGTLTGKAPRWSEEGRARLREGFDRGLGRRNNANRRG